MLCAQMDYQNVQMAIHAVSYHQVDMDVVLYQKQHAVQMKSTAVLMVIHVVKVLFCLFFNMQSTNIFMNFKVFASCMSDSVESYFFG